MKVKIIAKYDPAWNYKIGDIIDVEKVPGKLNIGIYDSMNIHYIKEPSTSHTSAIWIPECDFIKLSIFQREEKLKRILN